MDDDSIFKKYPNYEFFKSHLRSQRPFEASNNKNEVSKEILVQQMIGENSCDSVIEFSIPFPEKYPAFELADSLTNIEVTNTYILKDTVLLNGLIHKRINYIVFEDQYSYVYTGHRLSGIIGNQKTLILDIPFECSIKIPGISPKDVVNLEYAGVDTSNVIDIVEGSIRRDNVILYNSVKEKLIVAVHIKVFRTVQAKLTGG
jgi:hypothetical protein